MARWGVLVLLAGSLVSAAHACPQLVAAPAAAATTGDCPHPGPDGTDAKRCATHYFAGAQIDAGAPLLHVAAPPAALPALAGGARHFAVALALRAAVPRAGAPPPAIRFCRFLS